MRMCCVKCEREHAGGAVDCPTCGSRLHVMLGSMTPRTMALYARFMPAVAFLIGCRDPVTRATLRAEVAGLRRQIDEQVYSQGGMGNG